MRRLASACAATLLFGAATAGCAAFHAATAPEPKDAVRVKDVSARFTPGDEGVVTLELEVTHPGALAARVQNVRFDLWLNRTWFLSATAAVDQPVTPGTPVPVRLELPVSFRREGPASARRFVTVGTRGELELSENGVVRRLTFRGSKRQELENAPQPNADPDR